MENPSTLAKLKPALLFSLIQVERNLTYLKPVTNFDKVNMNLGVILSILWTLSSSWRLSIN